ncbi:hypothetical protein ACIGO6_38820 [Streptomyces sp. NPDC053750]|uniref:hypothetical protein n=1 Tax=Streptomyces sp. NPDC053750 TaxID=3365714 RepID=UPI0037D69E0D
MNTRTGLISAPNVWSDWSDGSERFAMPLLLQDAAARGLADPEQTGRLLDVSTSAFCGSGCRNRRCRSSELSSLCNVTAAAG